jgi:tryptophan-rich sensory protein
MNETIRRWFYCVLITGLVLITPIVGIWWPFANGNGTAPPGREYFSPAGFVFGTVWTIDCLGLAAFGVWQALPGQRYNERLRRALPWLAGTTLGNVLCQLVATA